MTEKYTVSDTITGIRRETKTFNYVAFILGLFVAVFVLGANGTEEGFYAENKLSFWMASYVLIFIGLFTPLSRAKYLPHGKRFYFVGFGLLVFLFLLLTKAVWYSFVPVSGAEAITTQEVDMIGYSVAVLLAVLGWFVQHQLTLQHNKTNHSLNVLLQMRVSEEFQQQTRLANEYYPSRNGTVIPEADVKEYHSSGTDFTQNKGEKNESNAKLKSISAHSYLLNYYEFLAFGICSGTLDEELLYQTLGGVLIGHVNRARNVVNFARKASLKTFVNLVELDERWQERRQFDSDQLTRKAKKQ